MGGPESYRFDLNDFLNSATGGQFTEGAKVRSGELRGVTPGTMGQLVENRSMVDVPFGRGEPKRE
ncbi:hypothetical protein KKC08_04800 [Patescibacteria group bacterium]|nr:hypothetical protein [Patescibacteria group bacterium]MCG2701972.1 hypothetical protein [Candidatus Parcubacteria bacterium]MBU4265026.1 hypothetical protein [Patescibacteria group bacterium]MBU4390179.1 hypothetical protein [Patescibacteria group bacterium]MBU4397457.1 hypothetical protein [Patescibacteria group bacterium]